MKMQMRQIEERNDVQLVKWDKIKTEIETSKDIQKLTVLKNKVATAYENRPK